MRVGQPGVLAQRGGSRQLTLVGFHKKDDYQKSCNYLNFFCGNPLVVVELNSREAYSKKYCSSSRDLHFLKVFHKFSPKRLARLGYTYWLCHLLDSLWFSFIFRFLYSSNCKLDQLLWSQVEDKFCVFPLISFIFFISYDGCSPRFSIMTRWVDEKPADDL